MKQLLRLFVPVCMLFLSSGCATSAFSGLYSAKPLGKGNYEFSEILTSSTDSSQETSTNPSARITFGLTDRLDGGLQLDSVSSSFFAKYTLFGSSDELSHWNFAPLFGHTRMGSSHAWNGGGILSYNGTLIEGMMTIRYFDVSLNPSDLDFKYLKPQNSFASQMLILNIGGRIRITPTWSVGLDIPLALNQEKLPFYWQRPISVGVSIRF